MRKSKGCKIEGLERHPERTEGVFADLTWEQQRIAQRYMARWQEKRRREGTRIKQWERPILVGQARRLARNPATSDWGRSMAAKKGGLAVQQQYRMEGRDPTAKASRVRLARLGMPARPRPDYPATAPKPPYPAYDTEQAPAPNFTHAANQFVAGLPAAARAFYRQAESQRDRKRGW